MTPNWLYFALLLVFVPTTIATGVPPMMRTALTIFIAWMINTLVVEASDTFDFWLFFIISDAVAAWIVLYHPAGRVQSVIGGLLLSQIVVHGVYGISKFISPDTLNAFRYMDVIDALGFLQLLLLGGWAGGHWFGAGYRAWRDRRHRLAGAEGSGGVA